MSEAHGALTRGEPLVAIEVLDHALDGLPTDDLAWPYLMERALEAELAAKRWVAFDVRLERFTQTRRGDSKDPIDFQIQNARIRAAKQMGIPETVEDLAAQVLDDVQDAYARATSPDDFAGSVTNIFTTAIDVDLALGRFERAIERVEVAFEHPAVQASTKAEVGLLRVRALAERQLEKFEPDRPRKAHESWRHALALSSSDVERSLIQLDLAEWALDEGSHEVAREHLDNTVVRGNRHVALEARWSRVTKAVEPARGKIERRLQEALLAMVEGWSDIDAPSGGLGRLLFNDQRMLLSEALVAEVSERGPGAGLELLARVHASTTASQRLNAMPSTLDDLMTLLENERHGVLVFSPLVSGGSSVFALDETGVTHARVPSFHEVEVVRRKWISRLDPGTPAVLFEREEELAATLGEFLLPGAIRTRLESWNAVSVCGLESWPVAWLGFESDGKVDRWGARWSLDRWTSLPVAVAASEAWPRGGDVSDGRVEVVACPDGPAESVRERWPHARPLPRPTELVAHVESVYGNVSVHAGADASVDAFFMAAEGRPSILQFVGHSVADVRAPEPGVLVLAADEENDGLLRSPELRRRLQMVGGSPETVLLLACRSEQLRERIGDPGAASAVGVWMSAGARAVVTTGTDVTFDQAAAASEAIHNELMSGASLADALMLRRRRLIEDHGAEAVRRSGRLDAHGLAHRGWVRRPLPARSSWPWAVVVAGAIAAAVWLRAR